MTARVVVATAAALVGFAGNSLLCRLALAEETIDWASFTGIRLLSGAVTLAILAGPRRRFGVGGGSWLSALALFLYAAPFSYAYVSIGAGIGALILFAAVQLTMMGWAVASGQRPGWRVWLGLVIAMAGLVGLTAPGRQAPDPLGSAIMATAGIAWGIYTLRGRNAGRDPLLSTAGNFARSTPLILVLIAAAVIGSDLTATDRGVMLAVLSGALASGVGYTLWYVALPSLPVSAAATLQLLVPILAAVGGVALLGEQADARMIGSGAAILGGVAMAIWGKGR